MTTLGNRGDDDSAEDAVAADRAWGGVDEGEASILEQQQANRKRTKSKSLGIYNRSTRPRQALAQSECGAPTIEIKKDDKLDTKIFCGGEHR